MSRSTEPSGVIHSEEMYSLSEFRNRVGISDATLRSARREGLKVYYLHKRAFIYGKDWIAYVLESCRHERACSKSAQSLAKPQSAMPEGV